MKQAQRLQRPDGEVGVPVVVTSNSAIVPFGDLIAARVAQIRSWLVFLVLDTVAVVAGYSASAIIYFRDRAPVAYGLRFALFVFLAIVVQLGTNAAFGLYGRMWRHASVEEARRVLGSAATALALLLLLYPIERTLGVANLPISVIVFGCALVTLGVGVLRFHSRLFAWQRAAGRLGLRVAIIGSRDAAAAAVRDMLHNPRAGLVPVVAFDDDPRVHGLSLVGVPVVGGIDEIPVVADQYSIQQVLLTVTNPSSELIERSLRAAESAGVALKILPGVREIVGAVGHPAVVDRVREPRIEDLLGRKEVLTDLEAVRQSLVGHRVLITGAGGSIGSEIARQVASFQPEVSILVDHDETHLHDVATFLSGRSETVLLDIRDRDAVFDAFSTYRPDVVFHAAAHKHVPVLEAHPIEAVTTNVFGTLNVVEAAVSQGVKQFVFISTDKAVQASSVMGAAKAVGERIVLDRRPADADYCAVRFGNVLGSRGSVIPTFKRQIALGGPVTVTDARMTRYFMSVEEAVQLVLQASVLEADRGIFMLEMGEPVRILDLAQRMIRLSGYSVGTDIPIRMTGIRSGEKLYEELSAPDERVESTTHPSILHLVPTINDHGALQLGLAALDGAVARRDKPAARELLFDLARHQRQGVGA